MVPIYARFLHVARLEGAASIEVALDTTSQHEGPTHRLHHTLNLERLGAALARPDCGVLLWCSPHNPSGRVWTRDELAAVARLCVKHDVLLLSDEVWSDIVYDPARTPFVGMGALLDDVPGLAERLIVVASPSKTYNIATADVAYGTVVDPDLRRAFVHAGSDKAETPPFGFAAALAALTDPSVAEWRRRLVDYLCANRDHVTNVLTHNIDATDVRLTSPEATYLTWMDISGLALPHRPAVHFQRHGVALTPGTQCGDATGVRLNFVTPRKTLDQGLECFLRGVDAALEQRERGAAS